MKNGNPYACSAWPGLRIHQHVVDLLRGILPWRSDASSRIANTLHKGTWIFAVGVRIWNRVLDANKREFTAISTRQISERSPAAQHERARSRSPMRASHPAEIGGQLGTMGCRRDRAANASWE